MFASRNPSSTWRATIASIGPGGVAKTSVALAVAERVRDGYGDRVVFVDLAPLDDPQLVLSSVAHALGIPESAFDPTARSIADWVGPHRTLLVADNFEHLLAAAADVCELVALSSAVQVLVTSRTPLRVAAEREVPIAPLAQVASVQLFVDRARSARVDFELTDANAAAVREICLQLDGLPLALELAAARIKVLSAEQIETDSPIAFASLPEVEMSDRRAQRTLRATLDWSYRGLTASECALLRRMAVFSGGTCVDAVEQVSSPDVELLDVLSGLVDHSLVTVQEHSGTTRYRLLETVRHYAVEQLRAAALVKVKPG